MDINSSDVESIVRNEIHRMQENGNGLNCTRNELYRIGKVAGMLMAFHLAGIITNEYRKDLFDYFMEYGI